MKVYVISKSGKPFNADRKIWKGKKIIKVGEGKSGSPKAFYDSASLRDY